MDHKIRNNKKSYTTYDIYNNYCREVTDEVPYSTFKRVIEMANEEIKNCIFNLSKIVKLPYGLGFIGIIKYKPKTYTSKSLSVDYKATREEGKTIYHLNGHSDGYKYRLYWSKVPQTFPDRYKYKALLVRQNKRMLAQLIFNHKDYINIDDIQIYKM